MKKIISLLVALVWTISLGAPLSLSAATGTTVTGTVTTTAVSTSPSSSVTSTVSQFEIITASTTVKAKEAIDVTVRAVDKDGKTVKSYRGSIAFATDRFGDVVPFAGKAIQFGPEDSGEKKFSK
jgi:hypothetical protein